MNIDFSDVPTPGDAVAKALKLVSDAQHDLMRLARAFEITGNTAVAETLADIAAGLVEPVRLCQRAVAKDLQGQISHGEHMVAGMLKLAIHGAIK